GVVNLKLQSASNNANFLDVDGSPGAPVPFRWEASAGQTYRVIVSRAPTGGPPFKYTLRGVYVAVDDPYEPNDTNATARPIGLGTTVRPYLFAGFKSSTLPDTAYRDCFSVQLAAGPASVVIAKVPHNLRMRFDVFDAITNVHVA